MIYDGNTVKQWAGESQWRAWRADLARFRKHGYSGWGSEGFWALTIYRIQRGLMKRRPRFLWAPARLATTLFRKLFTTITHISLNPGARIGPGLLIPHVGPIQVRQDAVIGADCAIHHVCTFASDFQPGGPVVGDHVMIGCHTCILGPVHLGDGVIVAVGAVVARDVPAWHMAMGVPARVFPRLDVTLQGTKEPARPSASLGEPSIARGATPSGERYNVADHCSQVVERNASVCPMASSQVGSSRSA